MTVHFYTVLDRGRLHIAADEKYQGFVESYNNWFTQFFAWLIGLSMDISVHEVVYRVNKRSYTHLLQSLKIGSVTNRTIQAFNNFSRISFDPANNGYMREHLTRKKVNKLSIEMIRAMVEKKDRELTERLLGQGADPDMYFCTRGWDGRVLFGEDPEEGLVLPRQATRAFQEGRYTPLLYATKNGDNEFRDRFLRFGANRALFGTECVFERKMTVTLRQREEGTSTSSVWVGGWPTTRIGIGNHRPRQPGTQFLSRIATSLGEKLRSVRKSQLNDDDSSQESQIWDVRRDVQQISYDEETKGLKATKAPSYLQETT